MSTLTCKHCGNYTRSSLDIARNEGWRTFKGASMTGKPLDDVVCPACADTAKPGEDGWDVRCLTCDWQWEDEYGEGPLSALEAKDMAREHECEPSVQVRKPGGPWIDPVYVDKDGKIKQLTSNPAAGASKTRPGDVAEMIGIPENEIPRPAGPS